MEYFERSLRTLARQWPALSCVAAAVAAGGILFSSCDPSTCTARARLHLRENPFALAPADFPAPLASAWSRSASPAALLGDDVLERAVREGLKEHYPSSSPEELASSVQEIRFRLSAAEDKSAGLLLLSCSDTRPSRAVATVNAVARAFDAAAVERRKRLIEDAAAFLDRAVRDRDQERGRIARESESLRPTPEEADFDRRIKSLRSEEERLSLAVSEGQAESASLAAECDILMDRIERADFDPPPPADTSESVRLGRELSAARLELDHLRATRPEDGAAIADASDRVDRLRRERAAAIDRELLETRFAPVRRMLDQLREKISRRDRLLASARDAQVRLDLARKRLQEHLQSRSPEAEAQARERLERKSRLEQDLGRLEASISDLRGLQARMAASASALPAPTDRIDLAAGAEPSPTTSPWPRWPLWILLGLVAGAGTALVLGRNDAFLKTESDVRRVANLPILGSIPIAAEEDPVLVRADPASGFSETWQAVAAVIESAARRIEAKTLLVTSPAPGEGKSTAACNLAVALARAGAQTLLVDADLRRPTQHEIFALSEEWSNAGLSAFLQQTIETVDPAIAATGIEGLSLLPAGPYPGPTAPFLRSERLGAMIEGLREKYDCVVVDAPPVQGSADTLLLSPRADAVLLVLAAGQTRKDDVTEAKRLLAAAGADLVGCILNKAPSAGRGYYSYSPYSYAPLEET